MESLIPKKDYTIKMKCVNLNSFDVVHTFKKPHGIFLTDRSNNQRDIIVPDIRKITDSEVKEFLPSRILPTYNIKSQTINVSLIYYINDMITSRPFQAEEDVFAFIIRAPDETKLLNYDGLVKRMFVDQFVCNNDVYYFFIMSSEDFQQLFENKQQSVVKQRWKDIDECLEQLANADKRVEK